MYRLGEDICELHILQRARIQTIKETSKLKSKKAKNPIRKMAKRHEEAFDQR